MRYVKAIFVTLFFVSTPSFGEPCEVPASLVDAQKLVHSMTDGIVTYSGYDLSSMKTVRIQQQDGLNVYYGNLGQIIVEIGQEIKSGQAIGLLQNQELQLALSLNNQLICGTR